MTRSHLAGASIRIVERRTFDRARHDCGLHRRWRACDFHRHPRASVLLHASMRRIASAALITSAWLAAGMAPGLAAAPHDEIGVLTCTVGAIVGNEAREVLCAFKTGRGPEETYAGLLRSIGDNTAEGRAILWSVRAPLGTRFSPGLLQQAYTADRSTPAGQVPALIGERSDTLSLHSLTEKPLGAASKEKQAAPAFMAVDMELVLQAAVG